MLLEAFVEALQFFGHLPFLLSMSAGLILGLILGIIPGLGALIGTALFLPFVFLLNAEQALPVIVGMHATSFMGGSITAILLNIPGTSPNAATLIDGFPMSQKGQGGRAVGAAVTASGVGSIITVVLALAIVPLILPMIMALRTADMVFIILLGISFIALLGSGSMIKGLIGGGLGMLIGLIGFQFQLGIPRFTFGSLYLYDGLNMINLALGLFAIPEMIALATRGGTIAQTEVKIKGMHDVMEGAKDVFRHWKLCLRCSIIGFVAGIIPGVGAAVSTFIAYGQAKATSKHPELFGTGIVEGVIAPESANDAKEGGAILTTLALGIPGSSGMVILLGAFYMVGLIPGPSMMTEHLALSLSLILIIAVASVIGAIILLLTAPYMVKIAFIPARILAPLVLTILLVGAFANQQVFNDVFATFAFAMLGLTMKKYGFNRPALLLGFILAPLFEEYLFIALQMGGPLFFVRPISLVLIFIMVAMVTYGPIKKLVQRRRRVKTA